MDFIKMAFAGILFSTVFVTGGCSGGSGAEPGDELRAQQTKESKILEELYGGVQGKWEGTVSNSTTGLQPFRAELTLYVHYVQDGTNPDGSSRLRPTLRGRFQPKDFVSETDLVTLVGEYDRSGRMVLTAQTAPTGIDARSRLLSLRGGAANGQVDVEVTREGGLWGRFTGKHTSTDASAPVAGELTDYRERFMRINGPIEGRYAGVVKSANGNDYRVGVSIVIVEKPLEGSGSAPTLIAQYSRLDVSSGSLEWALIVDYNSQTGEILMRNDPSSSASTVPGGMTLSLSGTLKTVGGEKVLHVAIRNRAALIGTLEAKR